MSRDTNIVNLDLDSVLTELTGHSIYSNDHVNFGIIETEVKIDNNHNKDEQLPTSIENIMFDALGELGIQRNQLYEDDAHALEDDENVVEEDADMLEVDLQLGPDADPKNFQNFPNFDGKSVSRRHRKQLVQTFNSEIKKSLRCITR